MEKWTNTAQEMSKMVEKSMKIGPFFSNTLDHSVHTGGRSGGGGGGGLLHQHAAWRHGARIEEPPPPCRVSGQLDRV